MNSLFGSPPSTAYNEPFGGQLNPLVTQASNLALNQLNNVPAYQSQALQGLTSAGNTYAGLASGLLPAGFTDNIYSSIAPAVQKALGGSVANLYASGTLGGDTLGRTTQQISDSASQQASNDYMQALQSALTATGGQTKVAGQIGQMGDTQQQQAQSLLNSLMSQNSTQVNPGSQGLLPSMLGGFASSGGLSSLLGL